MDFPFLLHFILHWGCFEDRPQVVPVLYPKVHHRCYDLPGVYSAGNLMIPQRIIICVRSRTAMYPAQCMKAGIIFMYSSKVIQKRAKRRSNKIGIKITTINYIPMLKLSNSSEKKTTLLLIFLFRALINLTVITLPLSGQYSMD